MMSLLVDWTIVEKTTKTESPAQHINTLTKVHIYFKIFCEFPEKVKSTSKGPDWPGIEVHPADRASRLDPLNSR